MEFFKSLIVHTASEIYFNQKQKLRGQLFALIAIEVSMILNKEPVEEFSKEVNSIYKLFINKAVQGSPVARQYFDKLMLISETNSSKSFSMIEKLGDGDLMSEVDMTRNIQDLEYARGVLAVEVTREASPVVRF